MRRLAATVFVAVIVATPAYGGTWKTLEAGLAALVGRPLEDAISKIGDPSARVEVGDVTVYTWTFGGSWPVGGTAVPVSCYVKLGVNKEGTILRGNYGGQEAVCSAFAKALKPRK